MKRAAPKGDSDELFDVFALEPPSACLHAGESVNKAHCATDVSPTTERYAWQYAGLLKGLVRVFGRFYGIIGAITIIAVILKLEDITLELGHHTPPLDSIPKHRPSDDPTRLALYNATMTAISQLSVTSERVCLEYDLHNCASVTPWAQLRPNDGMFTVALYLWDLEFTKVMQGFEDSVNSTDSCADWRLAAARAAVVYETRETAHRNLPLPLGQSLKWELHLGDHNYDSSCGSYQMMPARYAQLASIIGPRFNESALITGLPTGMLRVIVGPRDAMVASYAMIGPTTSEERIILKVSFLAKPCSTG